MSKELYIFLEEMKDMEKQGLIDLSEFCDPISKPITDYSQYLSKKIYRVNKIKNIFNI